MRHGLFGIKSLVRVVISAISFVMLSATATISLTHNSALYGRTVVRSESAVKAEKNLLLCEMHVVRRVGKHPGYSVDVRYPQFTGGFRPVVYKLNRAIKHIVDMNIAALPAPEGNSAYKYKCDFSTSLLTPRMVSLNFEFSSDLRGTGDKLVEVPLNAEIYPRYKILTLQDVLGCKVNYRDLGHMYLEEQAELRGLGVKATELEPAYFSSFTFNKHGITFRLPQGAFPEALQCPEATIAYSNLKSLIGTHSLIRDFLK
jgi:hypothetical protein